MRKVMIPLLLVSVLCLLFVGNSLFILSCSDDDDDNNNDSQDDSQPTALRLTNDNLTELYNTIWPGQNKILFDQPRDDNHTDICTVPLDGSCTKTIISPGSNTYDAPDINAAATHICYATGVDNAAYWEIGLYEIGGSETILTDNESNGFDSHKPVFNGDGSKIAYVRRDWSSHTDRLVTINVSGDGEIEVCTLASGPNRIVEALDWLTGTNLLIFTTRESRLYRVEAVAGATPVAVDNHVGYHTCFSSPDGATILAAQSHGTGQQYIEINPDGTNKRILVDPSEFDNIGAIFCQICWLPDKSGLVGLAQDASLTNQDLFLLTNFE